MPLGVNSIVGFFTRCVLLSIFFVVTVVFVTFFNVGFAACVALKMSNASFRTETEAEPSLLFNCGSLAVPVI